jgi:hypothetical protein
MKKIQVLKGLSYLREKHQIMHRGNIDTLIFLTKQSSFKRSLPLFFDRRKALEYIDKLSRRNKALRFWRQRPIDRLDGKHIHWH